MEAVWKLFAVGVLAAILCASVRAYQRPYAIGLSLAAAILLASLGIRLLTPVVRTLKDLSGRAMLEPAVFQPILRVCCIGLLTNASCAFCSEAGEETICRLLEFGGGAASLCALIPLLDSVWTLIGSHLGG